MVFRCEVVLNLAEQTDSQECGTNNYMEAMKAGSYKEGRAIDPVCDCKGRLVVLYALKEGEVEAEENG